jgi:hypothetical protein
VEHIDICGTKCVISMALYAPHNFLFGFLKSRFFKILGFFEILEFLKSFSIFELLGVLFFILFLKNLKIYF